MNKQKLGTLYVVATPIGNLADMVPRAVETLQLVQLIAAEDTRHSKRLMEHFHISTPMVAYHDHNEQESTKGLLKRLAEGDSIALISDAGTPLVSDPGYRLVRAARQAGIPVVPIPGACAAITALSVAGVPSDKFSFEGFLPNKSTQRIAVFEALVNHTHTLIFYEAPHRLLDCLRDLQTVFGEEREIVLARELTKTYETVVDGSVADLIDFVSQDNNQQKGEIVLVVRGSSREKQDDVSIEAQRVLNILGDLPPKKAAAYTAEITGVNKKMLYQWLVDNKNA
ncbi:16S rRNA (cytidine(1402)-2'-O)-methyltransferase [Aurantivibrio plasticivorans]